MPLLSKIDVTRNELKTDICIIGAGPAGATASLFLGKAGIPHLILDAATFPRDKICGDGLDLKVWRVLRHFDPEITENEVFANADFLQSWGLRCTAPNGKSNDFVNRPRPGEPNYPLIWTAKRLHFDNFLAKKIDPRWADFRQATKVERIARDGAGWKIFAKNLADGAEMEISAHLILAADGDHSIMLHTLGERKIERRHYAGTLRQYWRGIEGIHPKNLIEVYFPPGLPMSYFYMFPLPNGEANVGYGMTSEIASADKHNLRQIFAQILENDPVIAPRFRNAEPLETPIGWGIPLASRRRKAFGDGYLLLGDAASLVCPGSGEGIGTGMMSGLIAARFAERALAVGRFDAEIFKNYDREIYRRLHDEIRNYNWLMQTQPWRFYEWGLNRLIPSALYRRWFEWLTHGWLRTAYEKEIEINL